VVEVVEPLRCSHSAMLIVLPLTIDSGASMLERMKSW